MRRVFVLVPVFFLILTLSARAQFTIESVLDNGPINFGAGTEVQFTRFGKQVAVSATVHAALRGALTVVSAWKPELNRRLKCADHKRKYGVELTNISGTSVGDSLKIMAHGNIVNCTFGASGVAGNILITSTIEPTIIRNESIQLEVRDTSVENLGVYAVFGVIPVSDKEVSESGQEAGPQIKQLVGTINNWLNKQFLNSAVQKQIRAFKMQIQSAQLGFQGGDLLVAVTLSGQVPVSEVDRQLNF